MEPSQTVQTNNNVVCVTSNGSDLPAHKRSLIRDFARSFNTRVFKDIYSVIYGIISDFTDKGQFQ